MPGVETYLAPFNDPTVAMLAPDLSSVPALATPQQFFANRFTSGPQPMSGGAAAGGSISTSSASTQHQITPTRGVAS